MASAFDCANTSLVLATSSSPCVAAATSEPQEEQQQQQERRATAAESETEDEEVKMNCVGGLRGMEESDMNTTDHSCDESEEDDEDDEEESNNGEEEEQGVVSFVTGHLRGALPLVRPKATPPPQQRLTLSPHMEGEEELETSDNASSSDADEEYVEDDDDADASTASVGARGVALSLGTPSGISDADASSSENDGDDDDDDEDSDLEEDIVEPAELVKDKKQDLERELLGMNEVLGQSFQSQDMDESESALDHLLGVAQDRDDILNLPKTKRVLSFNSLAALQAETTSAGRTADSPKRLKSSSLLLATTSFMPAFCLGAPAVDHEPLKMNFCIQARHRDSPIISSSDEEDLDGQLRDELDPAHAAAPDDNDETSIVGGVRDNSPVPLLTPPGSPLTIEIDGGGTTTVCEWPSNLAVDIAMCSAADQEEVSEEVSRSMSPDVSLEQEDSDYTLSGSSSSNTDSQAVFDTSTLTPLLQGISVGNHHR
jgi:hypothetical protein